jgi:hypothetical protein
MVMTFGAVPTAAVNACRCATFCGTSSMATPRYLRAGRIRGLTSNTAGALLADGLGSADPDADPGTGSGATVAAVLLGSWFCVARSVITDA